MILANKSITLKLASTGYHIRPPGRVSRPLHNTIVFSCRYRLLVFYVQFMIPNTRRLFLQHSFKLLNHKNSIFF